MMYHRDSGNHAAVTRIRTWVTSATTKGTNHYTITAAGAPGIQCYKSQSNGKVGNWFHQENKNISTTVTAGITLP